MVVKWFHITFILFYPFRTFLNRPDLRLTSIFGTQYNLHGNTALVSRNTIVYYCPNQAYTATRGEINFACLITWCSDSSFVRIGDIHGGICAPAQILVLFNGGMSSCPLFIRRHTFMNLQGSAKGIRLGQHLFLKTSPGCWTRLHTPPEVVAIP